MEELVTGSGQSGPRAVEDIGGAGIRDGADVLYGHSDGEVVEAVVIKVAAGRRAAEEVDGYSALPNTPGLSWCQSWSPVAVRLAPEP